MSHVRAAEVVRAARVQNSQLKSELSRLEDAARKHKAERAALDKDVDTAWVHLGESVLPTLDAARLDALATALHLPALSTASVKAALDAERARLEARLRNAQSAPAYVAREAILLEVKMRLEELHGFTAPLAELCGRLEAEPLFNEIIDSGYGTPTYANRWFQLSYYRHWKHADLVVEHHGPTLGLTDFAGIRARYLEDRGNLRSLREREEQFKARRREVEAAIREHDGVTRALAELEGNTLVQCRARLRGHLAGLEDKDRMRLAVGIPALETALKRVAGTEAKLRYLDSLHEEMVVRPQRDLQELLRRNERDMQKLSRPKNAHRTITTEQFQKRFRDRSEHWNKRWTRYQHTRHQIVVFDRYHAYDPLQEMLWWDLMTDGRLDGNFIPEVHEHHALHGHGHHHHHAEDAAMAALADERVHGGGADLRDVS